jgi:hypothetical protein
MARCNWLSAQAAVFLLTIYRYRKVVKTLIFDRCGVVDKEMALIGEFWRMTARLAMNSNLYS